MPTRIVAAAAILFVTSVAQAADTITGMLEEIAQAPFDS
jgi:hypothetical protein